MQTAQLITESAAIPARSDHAAAPEGWPARLVRRSYVENSKLVEGAEFSVRIQSGASSFYFPLGTDNSEQAVNKATEIERCVQTLGWEKASRIYPREITVAIFWIPSPLCCTYTTIYSIPHGVPEKWLRNPLPQQRNCRVIAVHPEKAVRDAIRFWVDRQPGFAVVNEYGNLEDFLGSPIVPRANLVLVERSLIESEGGISLGQLRQQFPVLNILGLGVYEESNYIFHSVTGVRTGYILCRRQPLELFEPVKSLGKRPRMPARILTAEISRFFKTLFQHDTGAALATGTEKLTAREHDVLMGLARGFTEKEVAASLRISPLTVHNHVKRVYEKMDVHSRTEAVIKYLRTNQVS